MRRTTILRVAMSALLVFGAAGAAGAAAAADRDAADGTLAERPASATDSGEPAAAAGLLSALQRDLGLTGEQARERLADEARAAGVADAARDAAGAAFGGSWYDAEAGTLVVGVTDAARADAVRAAGARPETVRHTEAELDATLAILDDLAADAGGAPAAVSGWRVDPSAGAVVVDVVRGSAASAEVTDFLGDARRAGPVTVRTVAAPAATFAAGTVGGDPYYTGNVRCSIGFSVNGGFVTAGHCGSAGATVYGWDRSLMGQFQGSSFPGNDYAFVSIGHGWWTEPVVLGWGTVSDALVRGSAEAPVGASICRSGSTTGWHCGTVLGKNETVNYVGGDVVHQLTRTSVCAQPGDSGGSFISGDQAQGVTSGGWGNCSSGGETWYQPVNEILSVYGLTLDTW